MVFKQWVVISYAYKQTPYQSHSKLGCDNLENGTNLVMTTQNNLELVRLNEPIKQIMPI